MKNKSLQIQHLSKKLDVFSSVKQVIIPPTGWIKAIRTALGMSLEQLGNKLSITKQSVHNIELREQEGAITLKALREIAKALDMQLVYGFIPNEGSLEKLIESKATALATKIVLRTSNTMQLEDQKNSTERIKEAIQEKALEIKLEMPKILWD